MKLTLSQILLSEAHFQHASEPLAQLPHPLVPDNSPAHINVELVRGDDPSNVAIRLRVKSDPRAPYIYNVVYVVVLALDQQGLPVPADLDRRLMVTGANMAFPYVRELVSNFTARGRFGQTLVQPTDFSKIGLEAAGSIPEVTPT